MRAITRGAMYGYIKGEAQDTDAWIILASEEGDSEVMLGSVRFPATINRDEAKQLSDILDHYSKTGELPVVKDAQIEVDILGLD